MSVSTRRRPGTGSSKSLFLCLCYGDQDEAEESQVVVMTNERLSACIQYCDVDGIESFLKKVKRPQDLVLMVRRRAPSLSDYLTKTGGSGHESFYQEGSPLLWLVDCQQWNTLPTFIRYGIDPNRPLLCRRWTSSLCSPTSRPSFSPYQRVWTRGKYTYQSLLDYYFASIYELLGEGYPGISVIGDGSCSFGDLRNSRACSLSEFPVHAFTPGDNPLHRYFATLPALLKLGVLDIHRIDSVIVFNLLAASFSLQLTNHGSVHSQPFSLPPLPEAPDGFIELMIMRIFIENGFSQFEFIEFLSPRHHWFGLLLCIVCHPGIGLRRLPEQSLPVLVKQSSLLLINLLALRCFFPPNSNEFEEDSWDNLHLRKVYTQSCTTEQRLTFVNRLHCLRKHCLAEKTRPLSLKILARNQIRRQIGGHSFERRTATLPVPQTLLRFLRYIDVDHLKSCRHFPAVLVGLACGESCYDQLDNPVN